MDGNLISMWEAVRAGADVLESHSGHSLTVEQIQEVERKSQEIVLSVLLARIPAFYELPILVEEQDDESIERLRKMLPELHIWEDGDEEFLVLDSLDGSCLYGNGWREYGISLAHVACGRPLRTAIILPATGDVVLADLNHGCIVNGRRIELQDCAAPQEHMIGLDLCREVAIQRKEFHRDVNFVLSSRFKFMRNMPSVASGVDLLCGRTVAHVTGNAKIWDVAGTACAVEAAGGIVAAVDGTPMPWNRIVIPPVLLAAGETVARYVCESIRMSSLTASGPFPPVRH